MGKQKLLGNSATLDQDFRFDPSPSDLALTIPLWLCLMREFLRVWTSLAIDLAGLPGGGGRVEQSERRQSNNKSSIFCTVPSGECIGRSNRRPRTS